MRVFLLLACTWFLPVPDNRLKDQTAPVPFASQPLSQRLQSKPSERHYLVGPQLSRCRLRASCPSGPWSPCTVTGSGIAPMARSWMTQPQSSRACSGSVAVPYGNIRALPASHFARDGGWQAASHCLPGGPKANGSDSYRIVRFARTPENPKGGNSRAGSRDGASRRHVRSLPVAACGSSGSFRDDSRPGHGGHPKWVPAEPGTAQLLRARGRGDPRVA